MITLSAKINILGSSEIGTLTSASISGGSGINVSTSFSNLIGKKAKTNVSPFILGRSVLDTNTTYASDVGFFIGDKIALGTDAKFPQTYEIAVSGKNLKGVVLAFDDTHNRYPKSILVNGNAVGVNSATTYVSFDEIESSTQEITFPSLDKTVSSSGVIDFDNSIYAYSAASDVKTYEGFEKYSICTINGIEVGTEYTTVAKSGNVSLRGLSTYNAKFANGVLSLQTTKTLHKSAQKLTQLKAASLTLTATFTTSIPTIEIADWNTALEPLIISGLYTDLALNIDDRNISDINCETLSVGDTSLPSYGVYSNTGEIKFVDTTDEVRAYAEQLLLKSGLTVEIFVMNKITNAKERVAVYSTSDWDYKTYNKNVTVSLHDDLEDWQDIYVAGFYYDYNEKPVWTAKQFYEYLHTQTPSKYNMQTYSQLDTTTQNHLAEIIVQYPYLESGTLWEQWDKLCNLAQLHIYSQQGTVYCVYRGGE